MEGITHHMISRQIKTALFLFSLILIVFAVFFLIFDNCDAETITVDDDGEADFNYVQYAIENASSGDTVFIYSGWYYGKITINKSINLMGESPKNVSLYGDYVNYTISIKSDYVNISGLEIDGNQHGITISNSSHCNISNNFIVESFYYYGNSSGLRLKNSHNNTIFNNTFHFNFLSAMELDESNDNTITKNIFSYNMDHIYLYNSINNKINYNSFYQHLNFAINNTDDDFVDAQYNLWFSDNESEISSMMNGNVDFENWLDYDPTFNKPPVLVEEIPSTFSIDEGEINYSFIDLRKYFDDDYPYLRYEVVYNSEPSHVRLDAGWRFLQIDAEHFSASLFDKFKWHGTVEVIINATDILGGNVSSNLFIITVNDIYEEPIIEDFSISYTIYGRTDERISFNPFYLREGDKLVFKVYSYDDNKITRVEGRMDDGDWKVIYENASDQSLGEEVKCYYNWTVPRNGGGNHTFYFRAYDGVSYSNVTIEEIEVIYQGDKMNVSDVLFLLLLISLFAVIFVVTIIIIGYLLGKRGLKKYD